MNWDLVSVLVFYFVLLIIYYSYKSKFETQGLFVMYRTKFGLNLMDYIAKKFPRLVRGLSYIGIVTGFFGMAFILYFLVKETIKLVFVPGTPSALAPVLPGIEIPGAPALSFWHWVITIFVAAVVHEFAHGVVSRAINVPIKSSGFAFMGPLLAAFVEPEEHVLEKKSTWGKLGVFAAGPFSNIILGIIVLLFVLCVFSPFLGLIYDSNGINVGTMAEDEAMSQSGIEVPFTITSINGEEVLSLEEFLKETKEIKPGDEVVVGTDRGEYNVVVGEHPDDSSIGYFGILGLEENIVLKENFEFLDPIDGMFEWLQLLLMWLFMISIGVGLFNLLPLGPVDGGRMFHSLCLVFFNEKVSKILLNIISFACLALIIINMIPWIEKLLGFIWNVALMFVGFL
jgi:membrane-associated protease RseP (regulator of RpoE activity)